MSVHKWETARFSFYGNNVNGMWDLSMLRWLQALRL